MSFPRGEAHSVFAHARGKHHTLYTERYFLKYTYVVVSAMHLRVGTLVTACFREPRQNKDGGEKQTQMIF